ncbi:DEAD/DEAH box helicase family protein [[Mycoplasma] collis]|uniref:DEAD/DEAH box helicase family protein n=1 Tax=[Mycoplasma] collis TaxID=2127 RepID=UPI00068A9015|nr:DEAD/DEAH box helicase family protein [[Mycoplasma] collis]
MQLSNIQLQAVEKIVKNYQEEKIIQFQAPTGSGKTFMMANFIDKLISENYNDNLVFIIATLSSADLPKQMKNNLDDYLKYLNNKFEIILKESPTKSKDKLPKDKDFSFYAKKIKFIFLVNLLLERIEFLQKDKLLKILCFN